jgi:hypothetical protein
VTQRRPRSWFNVAIVAIGVAHLVGIGLLIWWWTTTPALAGPSRTLVFLAVAAIGCSIVAGVWSIRRVVVVANRTAERRETSGHLVCPWCLGDPVPASEPATEANAEATPSGETRAPSPTKPRRCCRRMIATWTDADYREYWALYDQGTMHKAAEMLAHGTDPAERPRPTWRLLVPMGATVGVFFFIGINVLFRQLGSGDGWLAAAQFAPMLLAGYGIDLMGRGIGGVRRTGSSCAACGYPERGSESRTRCPECGAAWRTPGALVTRKRERRPWFFVIGVLLVFATISLFILRPTATLSFALRMRSTPALIAQLGPNSFMLADTLIWAELGRRTLSAEEESLLFDHVAELRRVNRAVFGPSLAWMNGYLAGPRATEAQQERVRRESFLVEIVAPSRTRIDAELEVALRGIRTSEFIPAGFGVGIAIESIGFADEPPSPKTSLEPQFTANADSLHGSEALPKRILRSDRVGPRTIVVRGVLVARSFGRVGERLVRGADGSITAPADVLWIQPIEISKDIVVEP